MANATVRRHGKTRRRVSHAYRLQRAARARRSPRGRMRQSPSSSFLRRPLPTRRRRPAELLPLQRSTCADAQAPARHPQQRQMERATDQAARLFERDQLEPMVAVVALRRAEARCPRPRGTPETPSSRRLADVSRTNRNLSMGHILLPRRASLHSLVFRRGVFLFHPWSVHHHRSSVHAVRPSV